MFSLSVRVAPRDADEVIGKAASAARDADVAVVAVGLTEEQETEAVDKSILELPGRHNDLVRAVAAASARTVVGERDRRAALRRWATNCDGHLAESDSN